MRLIIVIIILLTAVEVSAFEIKNFRSGSACTDTKTFGWICHNTKDIYITGQSKCVWNSDTEPCTWFGYEFDYSDNKEGVMVDCEYERSESGSDGNPREIVAEDSKSGSYSFELKEESGRYYNPQYVLLSTQSKKSH